MGIHGKPYENALQDHKMIICETGMRKIMTAKYVEAAHAGCLIVGDRPEGEDHLFEDGVTFAEVDMENVEASLRSKILYYKKHEAERRAIVEEMKKRIKNYTTDNMMHKMEKILIENHEPRDESKWTCEICGEHTTHTGGMWINEHTKEGRICQECKERWIRKTLTKQ
jgi:hypothetical protein